MPPIFKKLNLARILIGIVFLINVQSAFNFLLCPGVHAPAFELHGSIGEAMIRGIGLLFLMWNVPYAVALWHPSRHRLSLYEALVMQTIGLTGEMIIRTTLPEVHILVRASVMRFITFDALGLLALIVSAWIIRKSRNEEPVKIRLS